MRVAIVGAGFSGIETAHRLKAEGHDFTLFERSDDVGGVWHDNTYPGAACDVPSYLYSFSWAQRRDWSRPCSPQEEIQRYLRGVAEQDGLLPHIRFGTEIAEARWDEQALAWTLTTGTGETLSFDALVLACGQLNRPAYPADPGRRRLRRHRLPLGPLGPRRRPARQARRGDRHRRERDPVRARDRRPGRPPRRLPAHRAVPAAAPQPALPGRGQGRDPPRAGAAVPAPLRHVGRDGDVHPRLHEAAAAEGRLPAVVLGLHAASAARQQGGPQEGLAETRVRLQADPLQLDLPAGAAETELRGRDRPRDADHRRRRGERRRQRAQGRRDHLGHRLRRRRAGRADAGPRHGRPRAAGALERGRPRPSRDHGRGLPEPVPDVRPEHEPRRRLDHRDDRGAGRLRAERAGDCCARAAARR